MIPGRPRVPRPPWRMRTTWPPGSTGCQTKRRGAGRGSPTPSTEATRRKMDTLQFPRTIRCNLFNVIFYRVYRNKRKFISFYTVSVLTQSDRLKKNEGIS